MLLVPRLVGRFVTFGSPTLPTVTGIAPAIGDINGGEAVTITGTNFTGATGATIGGNAVTSLVVVNPTTITCVTAAHAATTAANVAVTTGAGTGTGTGLYEFYDPTAIVDWYGSGEGYVSGTLTARKGVNLTEATHPPLVGTAGRALGGLKTIDSHTVTTPKLSAAATNLSTYLPLASGWGFAVVNWDVLDSGSDANAFNDGQVFSDNGGGYQGLAATSNVSNHAQVWGYDTAARIADASTVVNAGTWYMVIFKRDGTKIYQRLGSGSWSAGVACTTLGGTGNFKMFENYSNSAWLDGRVAVLGLGGSVPSDPTVTKLIAYVNAHWGQSF